MALSAADLTKYGDIIGRNGLTTAYSNKDDTYVSNEPHFITLNSTAYCSGMKWQCVEYARRWLMENRNIIFGDVQYATDIWQLSGAVNLSDKARPLTAVRYTNGTATEMPKTADLLIYDTSYAPITGHVSVIVEVGPDSINVAEQNYSSYKWAAYDYSQKLGITCMQKEQGEVRYSIADTGVIGWIRFIYNMSV